MKFLFSLSLLSFVIVSCGKVNNSNSDAVPTAPSALSATLASSTKAILSWTDNSMNESGFKIERKTATGVFGLIGITAANVTTYNDTLLSDNTNYTYRVYSYNSTGNSSTYTNEASISTIDTMARDTMASQIKNGLVAWYPFTGNAVDSCVERNDGIVHGAVLTTDRLGNVNSAYLFNGVDHYIGFNNAFLGGGEQNTFTIRTRVFLNSVSNNPSIWTMNLSMPQIFFGISSAKELVFLFSRSSNGGSATSSLRSPSNQIHTGEWFDVAIVFNKSKGQMYLNGLPIHTYHQFAKNGGIVSYTNVDSAFNFDLDSSPYSPYSCLGGGPYAPGKLNGKLDEFCIWNRALSEAEISYLATH